MKPWSKCQYCMGSIYQFMVFLKFGNHGIRCCWIIFLNPSNGKKCWYKLVLRLLLVRGRGKAHQGGWHSDNMLVCGWLVIWLIWESMLLKPPKKPIKTQTSVWTLGVLRLGKWATKPVATIGDEPRIVVQAHIFLYIFV